jgi:hypothetical protein
MPLQLHNGTVLNPQPTNTPTIEVAFEDPKVADDAPPEPVILQNPHTLSGR